MYAVNYRCISINLNVVEKFNQLKTPAKVSRVFKMVSVWFTRLHNHGEDCWSDSCPEDNHWHPSMMESKTQTFITKEAVHRVLYPSMLTESWVEGKDAQPTERTAALWGLSSEIDSRIWVNFTRNGLRLGSRHQEHHTQTCRGIWLQLSSEASYLG